MSAKRDETWPRVPGEDELAGLDQAYPWGIPPEPAVAAVGGADGDETAREIDWKPDPSLTTSKVVALFLLTALERIVVADEVTRH